MGGDKDWVKSYIRVESAGGKGQMGKKSFCSSESVSTLQAELMEVKMFRKIHF